MSEVWETFDDLFRALRQQGKRVDELENRLAELEKSLEKQAGKTKPERLTRFPRLEKAA
jgi:predicted RNase H-like nuclease (RuvC/YqgF family)